MRVTINYPGELGAGIRPTTQVIILEGVVDFDDYPEQRRDVRMQIQHIAAMIWDTPSSKNIFFEDECGLCQKRLVEKSVARRIDETLGQVEMFAMVCPVHGT